MIKSTLSKALNSKLVRMTIAIYIVGIPTFISLSWVDAAYQSAYIQQNFGLTLIKILFTSFVLGSLNAYAMLYPADRWLIRDRAVNDWKWIVVRIVLYLLVSIPMSILVWLGTRLTLGTYPPIVESSDLVIGLSITGVIAVLHSLIERTMVEINRRESVMKRQIEELRIEIDAVKQKRQVDAIVESEAFQDLKAKAQALKAQHSTKAP